MMDKQIIDYLDENPFETNENQFFMNRSYKCCITIKLIKAKELVLLKVVAVKNS